MPSVMSWPRPPNESPRTAATVARPIVVTLASRMPAMISGTGKRQLDPEQALAAGVAHALGRLEDLRRDRVEAGGEVAEEDQQRVGRQRDERGDQRQPEDRPEDGERGQARDRVEEPGDRGDRAVGPRLAEGEIGEDQRDDDPEQRAG